MTTIYNPRKNKFSCTFCRKPIDGSKAVVLPSAIVDNKLCRDVYSVQCACGKIHWITQSEVSKAERELRAHREYEALQRDRKAAVKQLETLRSIYYS
jgi:hypothetical protein